MKKAWVNFLNSSGGQLIDQQNQLLVVFYLFIDIGEPTVRQASIGVPSLTEKGPEKVMTMTTGLKITEETSRRAVFIAYQTDSEEVTLSSVYTFPSTGISLKRALPIR